MAVTTQAKVNILAATIVIISLGVSIGISDEDGKLALDLFAMIFAILTLGGNGIHYKFCSSENASTDEQTESERQSFSIQQRV